MMTLHANGVDRLRGEGVNELMLLHVTIHVPCVV